MAVGVFPFPFSLVPRMPEALLLQSFLSLFLKTESTTHLFGHLQSLLLLRSTASDRTEQCSLLFVPTGGVPKELAWHMKRENHPPGFGWVSEAVPKASGLIMGMPGELLTEKLGCHLQRSL